MADEGLGIARIADGRIEQPGALDRGRDHRAQGLVVAGILDHGIDIDVVAHGGPGACIEARLMANDLVAPADREAGAVATRGPSALSLREGQIDGIAVGVLGRPIIAGSQDIFALVHQRAARSTASCRVTVMSTMAEFLVDMQFLETTPASM